MRIASLVLFWVFCSSSFGAVEGLINRSATATKATTNAYAQSAHFGHTTEESDMDNGGAWNGNRREAESETPTVSVGPAGLESSSYAYAESFVGNQSGLELRVRVEARDRAKLRAVNGTNNWADTSTTGNTQANWEITNGDSLPRIRWHMWAKLTGDLDGVGFTELKAEMNGEEFEIEWNYVDDEYRLFVNGVSKGAISGLKTGTLATGSIHVDDIIDASGETFNVLQTPAPAVIFDTQTHVYGNLRLID